MCIMCTGDVLGSTSKRWKNMDLECLRGIISLSSSFRVFLGSLMPVDYRRHAQCYY